MSVKFFRGSFLIMFFQKCQLFFLSVSICFLLVNNRGEEKVIIVEREREREEKVCRLKRENGKGQESKEREGKEDQ